MKLYIVRHAIAVPHGTPGVAEDDRYLTEDGSRKMRKAATGLLKLGIVPDIMLSSPLVRARQTAEILIEVLGKNIRFKLTPHLAPWGRRGDLYEELQRHRKLDSVMLVGHQPSLGEIAGEIAWGSPEHYVELKKGGTCAIDLRELRQMPRGTLLFLLTPSLLRKLGS